MARCFMTSVEFPVEKGYVLNRTAVYRLLRALRKRSESLERLVTQLSPLDDPHDKGSGGTARNRGKQHRMICKAVADALGQAYPEIELFLSWPALLARNLRDRMRLLKEHPIYGASLSGMPDDDLVPLAKLGQQVVRLIDPHRKLPPRAMVAIKAGICVRHRADTANEIAKRIRSTISGGGDLVALGVAEEEHKPVRASLMLVMGAAPPKPSSHEGH